MEVDSSRPHLEGPASVGGRRHGGLRAASWIPFGVGLLLIGAVFALLGGQVGADLGFYARSTASRPAARF